VDAEKAALGLQHLSELVIARDRVGVGVPEFGGALQHAGLDRVQHLSHRGSDPRRRHAESLALFAGQIAAGQHHGVLFHVARADLEPHRHAAHLPIVELETGVDFVPGVQLHPDARGPQRLVHLISQRQHGAALRVLAPDRHDHDLDRRQAGRQHQPLVVAVAHDDGADHARADAPTGGPGVLELIVLVQELDIECPGKVLAHEVAGARLQRPAVAHHRLDAVAGDGAGELLPIAFLALDHRQRSLVDGEVGVDVQHAQRLLHGFLLGGVGGVAFLPQEFGGAQEEAGAHLPAHHVGPLVDQQRQVAVGAHPLAVHVTDDGLRRRANHQRLL